MQIRAGLETSLPEQIAEPRTRHRLLEHLDRLSPSINVGCLDVGQRRRELPPVHTLHRPKRSLRRSAPISGRAIDQHVSEGEDEWPIHLLFTGGSQSLQPFADLQPFGLAVESFGQCSKYTFLKHTQIVPQ